VIDALQLIHSAGYTHNDIKPANIMLDINDQEDKLKVTLIDFGFAKQYINMGKHIEQSRMTSFQGNLIFSSINQMNFISTSRRDDIISMCYIFLTLLNHFSFPIPDDEMMNPFDESLNITEMF